MNEIYEKRKEAFMRAYSNVPLQLRRDTIAVIPVEGETGKPVTWDVAYFEIRNDTPAAVQILEQLDQLHVL
jgi:hypothetical protein